MDYTLSDIYYKDSELLSELYPNNASLNINYNDQNISFGDNVVNIPKQLFDDFFLMINNNYTLIQNINNLLSFLHKYLYSDIYDKCIKMCRNMLFHAEWIEELKKVNHFMTEEICQGDMLLEYLLQNKHKAQLRLDDFACNPELLDYASRKIFTVTKNISIGVSRECLEWILQNHKNGIHYKAYLHAKQQNRNDIVEFIENKYPDFGDMDGYMEYLLYPPQKGIGGGLSALVKLSEGDGKEKYLKKRYKYKR